VFIARAVCGVTHVTIAALFCSSSSLLCISNSDWATENEAGRSVSVNGNEEPRWRDLSPKQFSCNCSYSLITHNKTPVHSTWGLLRVCAACPTPRLNLSSEHRPSWEKHPRYVPHRVRNGYNRSDVGGRGHNENWSLFCMPKKLTQRNEASTTKFKDDALKVTVILLWMKRAFVLFRKFEIMNVQEI